MNFCSFLRLNSSKYLLWASIIFFAANCNVFFCFKLLGELKQLRDDKDQLNNERWDLERHVAHEKSNVCICLSMDYKVKTCLLLFISDSKEACRFCARRKESDRTVGVVEHRLACDD
jgi:hypothetical protein